MTTVVRSHIASAKKLQNENERRAAMLMRDLGKPIKGLGNGIMWALGLLIGAAMIAFGVIIYVKYQGSDGPLSALIVCAGLFVIICVIFGYTKQRRIRKKAQAKNKP